ncbi:ribokinase [Alicyclobacillus mali (ex Roth et al. 2021)]|uniref:ribokinase n=1 Tax=Alicyclobacillus mali (ex Roth et al. 2021) TaxID=1123961 RepID=UPI002DD81212|nr:ribokinase [Alicyclobacillus mali (ex Roth et al. 2021)]
MDAVVIGSINVDLVVRVREMPGPGATVLAESARHQVGGKGANQAIAAARQGVRVRLIGALGTDAFAPMLKDSLAHAGIDISGVAEVPGPSGTALIFLEPCGQNRIVVIPGANAALSPESVERTLLATEAPRETAVMLQNEIPRDAVMAAIRAAHLRGWRVVWNVAPPSEVPAGVLRRGDVIAMNEVEAAQVTGREVSDERTAAEAAEAAEAMLARGAGLTIVTLGPKGVVATSARGTFHLPAWPVEVRDTTAAGDTWLGAFVAAWDGGEDVHEALRYATAAASLCVSRMGAADSIPARREVEAFLRSRPQGKFV